MAIVINGSGTITGLSVGGLPDGCVDTDMLATDAVTNAKVANDAINTNELVNSAVTAAKSSGIGGITDFDEWYVGGNTTGNQEPYTSWTRSNTTSSVHGIKGGTMSHSSGIWTFPSTGYWFVSFTAWTFNQNRKNRYSQYRIKTTSDNSSYSEQAAGGCRNEDDNGDGNGATYVSAHCHTIFDVQDTSTHKVRFDGIHEDTSSAAMGGRNFTHFTVMKLGDT